MHVNIDNNETDFELVKLLVKDMVDSYLAAPRGTLASPVSGTKLTIIMTNNTSVTFSIRSRYLAVTGRRHINTREFKLDMPFTATDSSWLYHTIIRDILQWGFTGKIARKPV